MRGVEFCNSTRYASEFGRKWGTVCLNTRLPLPTVLFTGYSVKLINWILNKIFIYLQLKNRSRALRESALIGRLPKLTRTSAFPLVCQVATNAALGTATQHAMPGTAGGGGQNYK